MLSVQPGIIDPAALVFHRESEELVSVAGPGLRNVTVLLSRKVDMYVDYVNQQCFLGDVRLLARSSGS